MLRNCTSGGADLALTDNMKASALLPSVHAYLATRYPKAAKALRKEALLAPDPARDTIVPLEAAVATWSRRQARRGLDGAADLPHAVLGFLADCRLERAARVLRKEAAVAPGGAALPLLEAATLHARRAAKKRARRVAGGGALEKKARRRRSASEERRAAEARAAADAAERRAAADAVAAWVARQDAAPAPPPTPAGRRGPRAPGRQFERIDSAAWLATLGDERLKDNSYEGTHGDGGWGARASAKLSRVRGKDFRHEKTKRKRGGYRGGAVDLGSNSIKFAED